MLIALVLAGFAAAAAAPALYALAPRRAGLLLAVYPGAALLWLLGTPDGATASLAWAPSFGLDLAFALDGLSRLFALLITAIGVLVLVYADAYMAGTARLGRFFGFLVAFMASMLGVVLADNAVALFVFWELTSITSFLLIGFEQERPAARAAALQALYVTAGGGLALLAGLVLLEGASGTTRLSALAAAGDAVRGHAVYLPMLVLILLGAFTKSAQVPFHFWLPNAMEAPTPVSAYLHSSTMVKAGVYLLARLHPALGGTAAWITIVGAVGAVTAIAGAVLAWRQTDTKRILAYSTISALGTITMLLGLGTDLALTAAALFVLTHALYKGALFLVAGILAHETGERDITRLRGLGRAMPLTAMAALLAGLSMAGVPPFGGFVAKELLLEAVLHPPAAASAAATAVAVAAVLSAGTLLAAVAFLVGVRIFSGPAPSVRAHDGGAALWAGALLLGALGAAAGLMPGWFADPLVGGAAGAMGASSPREPLALWHGATPALAAGLLVLLAGAGLAARWSPESARAAATDGLPGPDRAYASLLRGLTRFAAWQTARLQNGYLPHYLLITVGTAGALGGVTYVVFGAASWPGGQEALAAHEAVLLAVIVGSAVAAARSRSRLGSVAALGITGYGVALIYVMFGAPDLAMTQFVVETLTVILFLFAVRGLPAAGFVARRGGGARHAAVAGAAGVLMAVLVAAANGIRQEPPISRFFVERSVPDAHGRNVVNVILVDFRALDTLGEISVLALAGVGVYALLKLRPAPQAVRR